MNKIAIITSLSALILIGSSCGTSSVKPAHYLAMEDGEIDSSSRQEIHSLNDNIIATINSGTSDELMKYMEVNPATHEDDVQKVRDTFTSIARAMKDKELKLFKDYYFTCSGEGNIICTVFPKIDYDFQVNIPRIGDEMYLSLLETQEFEKLMISLEYIKQDGKWKVHGYYINSFKIADKNAMQWYEEALPYYGKGYLVPALFRLEICRRCLNPAPFLKYQKETEIMKLAEKVEEDFTLRYPLPMELVKINNSPLLYNIRAQFVQNDIVPVVWYITSYDLRDIDNLHVEADAMSPVIQEMFPGITEGTQYLSLIHI